LISTAILLGGIGSVRAWQHTSDRLDASEVVEAGVELDPAEEPRSMLRRGWDRMFFLGCLGLALAALAWLDGGDRWIFVACGLVIGVSLQTLVEERMIRQHELAEGVRVFQPEDPDDWFKQATGKELGTSDPGPLFHAGPDPD